MILSGFQDSWADQIRSAGALIIAGHSMMWHWAGHCSEMEEVCGDESRRGEPGLFAAWVTLPGNVSVFHSIILSHDLIFPRLKAD